MNNLYTKIVNSWLWFHLYYKHTKAYKAEVNRSRAEVLAIRK